MKQKNQVKKKKIKKVSIRNRKNEAKKVGNKNKEGQCKKQKK